MRFLLTLWLCKFVAFAVSIIDKARGSNYSGKIAIKLMPDFVGHFKNVDYDKTIFLTGTNGKSTNTNLLYQTFCSAGLKVACNTEGANMMGGAATTLIKNSTITGKFNKEYLILEVDERSLPAIRKVLPAKHMGITNLQKDQVQRNGDPDFILRKFRGAIGKDMTLYLNNEEPRSRSLEDVAGKTVYYGVDENSRTYIDNDFYCVTLPCPKCGHAISYKQYNLANIGPFHCTKCDYSSKDNVDFYATEVDFENATFLCNGNQWKVNYNNPFYIYNFVLCITIATSLGLSAQQIQTAFAAFKNPASHADIYTYCGKEVHYLRGKQENPEALQSQIDIITADRRKKAVFVGMHCVCDFMPYYSGSFYLFDCNFKAIVDSGVENFVAFSKTVANDIASRMILAGAPKDNVAIYDTDDISTVFPIIKDMDVDVVYILTNTKHAKMIKNFLAQGENNNG